MPLYLAAEGKSALPRGQRGPGSHVSDRGVSVPRSGVVRHHHSPAGDEGPAASPGHSLPWPQLLEAGGGSIFFMMLKNPREKPENMAERSETNEPFEACVL